jgi:membrane dipeptidase
MRRPPLPALLAAAAAACAAPESARSVPPGPALEAHADELAHRCVIVDTHIDVPYRLRERMDDVSVRTADGHFDYPRAVAGGLDAPFLSIYVPSETQADGSSRRVADELIDLVEVLVARSPDKFVLATSSDAVRRAHADGRIAFLMGMENGAPLDDLEAVDHFFQRGIRYVTLCHAKDNRICDSSYDESADTNNGLSDYGRAVVRRMNELGILVDVSHISDKSFWDVMEATRAPAIASHSALRHFTPGWERNMSDDMVRRLARNGGVVQINFGSYFLTQAFQQASKARREAFDAHADAAGLAPDSDERKEAWRSWHDEHPIDPPDVAAVADHIDRAVELAGIDHVGLGSDFDGVDDVPRGLEDVSCYPNLIAELLRRGYTDEDVEKICSGNVLRVLDEAQRVAGELRAAR